MGRITWYVNSRAMLEPSFQRHGTDRVQALEENIFRVGAREPSSDRGGFARRFPHAAREEQPAKCEGEAIVLVPVDFSPGSFEAARAAVSMAKYSGASVLFCHATFPKVIPFGPAAPPWLVEGLRSEAVRKLAPFRQLAEQAGVKAECLVEEGTPTGVILKLARTRGVRLIVLSSREHSAWARVLFGKTIAEQVAEEADCDVMLVRRARP